MLKLLIMGFLLSRSTSLSAGLATNRAASRLLSRRVQYRAAMTALRPLSWEVANNQSSPDGQFESARIPATAELLRAMPRSNPNSVNNIIALLRSDAIKGIGPKLASALTTRFGERTLVVLRGAGSAQEEAALHTIPGLHVKKIANIRRTVDQWEGLRKSLDFGRSLGCLSEAQVSALASQHGERTEEVVRQDPYVLLELFPTLRFRDVDFLARNALHVAADASSRASAALRAGLRRALGRGHCCTPRQRLLGAAAKELQLDELPYEEASAAAERALAFLVARGAMVEETPPKLAGVVRTPPPMVSFAVMQAAERHVADAVRRRIARPEGATDALFGRYDAVDVQAPSWASVDGAMATTAAAAAAFRAVAGSASFGAGALAALSGGGGGPLSDAETDGTDATDGTDNDDAVCGALAASVAGSDSAALRAGTGPPGAWAALNASLQTLSPLQRQAVERAGMGKLMVLTGGPGTGKTFTVRAIVQRWRAEGKEVLLASPTARAANVLAEAVGGAAYTIHRLLEYNPREGSFMRAANNPLQADAVVIDEASMLDVHLAGELSLSLPRERRLGAACTCSPRRPPLLPRCALPRSPFLDEHPARRRRRPAALRRTGRCAARPAALRVRAARRTVHSLSTGSVWRHCSQRTARQPRLLPTPLSRLRLNGSTAPRGRLDDRAAATTERLRVCERPHGASGLRGRLRWRSGLVGGRRV